MNRLSVMGCRGSREHGKGVIALNRTSQIDAVSQTSRCVGPHLNAFLFSIAKHLIKYILNINNIAFLLISRVKLPVTHLRTFLYGIALTGILSTAGQAATLDVSLSSASGSPGQDVTVSLSQQTVPDRSATTISVDLPYDTSRLRLKTYANGSAIEANEFALVDTTKTPGLITIVVADLAKVGDPLFGLVSGEMLRVTFTIQPTATVGTIPLQLTNLLALDQVGQGISGVTKTDGVLTVVASLNSAPVAQHQTVTLAEDTTTSIRLSATDVDGDALVYRVVTGPTYGALTGTAPTLTYTPVANYNGPDSFTFTANDGKVESNLAMVSLTITAVNDPPIVTISVNPLTGTAPLTVSFDASGSSDVEGVLTSYSWDFGDGGSGSGGSVNHIYTGAGTYTAILTVTDTEGATATASGTISVASAADTTASVVSITAPTNGAVVSLRSLLTIQASAMDNIGVAQVTFYVGGRLKCTDTTSPYACVWKVPAKAGKTYQLQAKASDAAGNVGSSSIVTVTAR